MSPGPTNSAIESDILNNYNDEIAPEQVITESFVEQLDIQDENIKDDRPTAEDLFNAINENNISSLNQILEYRIKLDVTNGDGRTALHLAAQKGFTDIASTLILNGKLNYSTKKVTLNNK